MRVKDPAVMDRIRSIPMCEWCEEATPHGAEPNHIWAKGMGGGSRLDVGFNLIAMCHLCHRKWHDGNLKHEDGRPASRLDLFGIAAQREVWLLLNPSKR